MTTDQVTSGRPYRGVPAEVRAAERRERLLEAALELYGRRGHAKPTIAQVCARAHVTTRNFYDAFGGREELLLALYERVLAEQAARVREALAARDPSAAVDAQVRPVVEAAVRPWAEDVRKARVVHLEVLGVSPELDRRRLQALAGFARLVANGTGAPLLVAIALVGAVNQSLILWHTSPPDERAPIDDVIDTLVGVAVRTLDL